MSKESDITPYMDNRASLLDRVLSDHDRFEQARGRHMARWATPDFVTQWYDGDGREQVTRINEQFMAGHRTIIHALIVDLAETGPAGGALASKVIYDVNTKHESDPAGGGSMAGS